MYHVLFFSHRSILDGLQSLSGQVRQTWPNDAGITRQDYTSIALFYYARRVDSRAPYCTRKRA